MESITLFGKVFRFCIVGLLTAVIFFGIFEATLRIMPLRPYQASSVAYIVAVLANYLLHYHWTYRVQSSHAFVGARYILMIFSGFLINVSFMYLAVELAAVHHLTAQLIAVMAIATFNFFVATYWVFQQRKTGQ